MHRTGWSFGFGLGTGCSLGIGFSRRIAGLALAHGPDQALLAILLPLQLLLLQFAGQMGQLFHREQTTSPRHKIAEATLQREPT